MLANRSMPPGHVIPVLGYPDVPSAITWLCDTFGYTVRWRVGAHRAQLNVGNGTVAVTEHEGRRGSRHRVEPPQSVMVRVEDVNAHHERARKRGARILHPPADFPYGERQYTVEDLAGHVWTFSQSIADVAPEAWGGTSGQL